MLQVTAFSDPVGALDRTTWQYDLAAGLLTNKVYADGKGTAYTYTPEGRLSRRTWARGVTTDYAYDSLGQMTNINYSDTTPDVSLAYDRLGRQTAITDGQGARTFTYNDTLQLHSELLVAAAVTPWTNELTRAYDPLGRSAGFSLDADYSAAYAYDALGRFASVSNSVGGALCAATYSYLPDADLLEGYDLTSGTNVFQARKTYEPNRNLIATVSNLWNGTVVVADSCMTVSGSRIKPV